MTLSIIAWDEATGALGAAAATKFIAVGALSPHVVPGVGAMACQAFIHPGHAPRALELLALRVDPVKVLEILLEDDEHLDHRQIHVVDKSGISAAFTGVAAGDWAGHLTHPTVSVAGNMLAGEAVLMAMLEAYLYHLAQGYAFPERLLAALEAGQLAGGDKRGQQSASLHFAPADGGLPIDLRVDDHVTPLAELRRIYAKAVAEYAPLRQFLISSGHLDADAEPAL